jgi:predicted nucleic acid-binding protein
VKFVIETNVVAYYLLGTQPFAQEARRFLAGVGTGLAPVVWEAELANVIWMAIRTGAVTAEVGAARLTAATQLGIESVPTKSLCHGALRCSVKSGVAVYDTLFVELAVREGCPLATFDKGILRAFPGVAARPGVLAGAE